MDPVLEHHYNNMREGKTRQEKDGYINSVFTIQVDKIKKLNNGKPTLIPTVYDGKIVSEKEAIKKAIDSGKKWTSADTHKQLREYDKKLHKQMSPELAKGTFNKGGTTMKNDPPKEKYKGEAQAKAVRKYFADVQKEYDFLIKN